MSRGDSGSWWVTSLLDVGMGAGVIGHWYSAFYRLTGWKAPTYLRLSLHFLFIPFLFSNSSQINELSSLEGLVYLLFTSCGFFL